MSDTVVTPLAEALLECLRVEVAKLAVPPAQVCLRTGDVVNLLISLNEDECCSGLAWVRVAGFYPSTNFPEPMEIPFINNQFPSWAVELEMGVARCAPTSDATHNPTCAQWTGAARAVNDDGQAMRDALCCFIDSGTPPRKGRVLPQLWQPLTTEGGCTGGIMSVLVRANPCAC
ncbi:MAG: hypothetical protein ACRD0W_05685 [Acidimicrobiales bacterium]